MVLEKRVLLKKPCPGFGTIPSASVKVFETIFCVKTGSGVFTVVHMTNNGMHKNGTILKALIICFIYRFLFHG